MANESYIIIFCRIIYCDMLSMQHGSKQELNNIYNFFLHFCWFPRGIHVYMLYVLDYLNTNI